jgi:hypothetical protein
LILKTNIIIAARTNLERVVESPSVALCRCPNGCVLLTFGFVTVHLPRPVFLLFAQRVRAVAVALDRGGVVTTEH